MRTGIIKNNIKNVNRKDFFTTKCNKCGATNCAIYALTDYTIDGGRHGQQNMEILEGY